MQHILPCIPEKVGSRNTNQAWEWLLTKKKKKKQEILSKRPKHPEKEGKCIDFDQKDRNCIFSWPFSCLILINSVLFKNMFSTYFPSIHNLIEPFSQLALSCRRQQYALKSRSNMFSFRTKYLVSVIQRTGSTTYWALISAQIQVHSRNTRKVYWPLITVSVWSHNFIMIKRTSIFGI